MAIIFSHRHLPHIEREKVYVIAHYTYDDEQKLQQKRVCVWQTVIAFTKLTRFA